VGFVVVDPKGIEPSTSALRTQNETGEISRYHAGFKISGVCMIPVTSEIKKSHRGLHCKEAW